MTTDKFNYKRRPTITVNVGDVSIGSQWPIRLQSMTNTSTMDTPGSVAQTERIADRGGEIVRLTAQGVREGANLADIHAKLRADGYSTPLVADIHFNPKAAFEAAKHVEKVRINPGNFVDPGRTFKKIEFTDEEYAGEIRRIEAALVPFLDLCRDNHTAIRIGVNHGSLSDRIMSRYGDTPAGMVESAMEFLRIAKAHGFNDIVISIKASNTVVMVETVRRLVQAMDKEGMDYPLHLGVTEAGDGDDGRVRSAVGIGALLADGIGDTIRVSLSEPPEDEIPVARELRDYIAARANAPRIDGTLADDFDIISPRRRPTVAVGIVGGDNVPVVVGHDATDSLPMLHFDASGSVGELASLLGADDNCIVALESFHANPVGEMRAAIHAMTRAGMRNPVVARLAYTGATPEQVTIRAAADFGALLLDGLIDGIWLEADSLNPDQTTALALNILQAARRRFTHTEFISCPSCGRTLFDLQQTVKKVKEELNHLSGLKIAVMGCIVNGPGEMADADYGYVGAAAGNVSLYRGKECVEKNIPSDQALPRLIALLKADGKWIDKP